jgi:predicted Rossmann fold nucleotide-binding protein DprA/Smf involved in DNA uptake
MSDESNLDFAGKASFQRLTSLEEDRKREQVEIRRDRLEREMKRTTKSKPEIIDLSYERFPEENKTNA